jgi:hypothetical protein
MRSTGADPMRHPARTAVDLHQSSGVARLDVERRMTSIKVPAQLPAHAAGVKRQIDSPMLFIFCCGV